MAYLSIIIPFYNTEISYFNKCIESILQQTYQDWEAIIIDDGSRKEYWEYLEKVKQRDIRFVVYHEENKGVSVARNFALQYAKGQYVMYIDSDDYICNGSLQTAVDVAESTQVDFIIGGVRKTCEHYECCINGDSLNTANVSIYEHEEIKNLRQHFISSSVIRFSDGYISRGPVARLVRKDVAIQAKFPDGIRYGEDIIWNQLVFNLCQKVALVQRVWYIYNVNKLSVTQTYNPCSIPEIEKQINYLADVLDLNDNIIYYHFVKRMFGEIAVEICDNNLCNHRCRLSWRERLKIFNSLRDRYPWNCITKRFLRYATRKEKAAYYAYKAGVLLPVLYLRGRWEKKRSV